MDDSTGLLQAVKRHPKAVAFVLWGMAGVISLSSLTSWYRAYEAEHQREQAARAQTSQCKPWHLPKKSYGIVEQLPPGDWCIHVGVGQVLEVKTAGQAVEWLATMPISISLYGPHGNHLWTREQQKDECVSIREDWGHMTIKPVDSGGEVRVRVGPFKDSISKC